MAIEGIDGCGKTTQAKFLVYRLRKNGYEAVYIQPIFALAGLICLGERSKNLISPRRARISKGSNKNVIRALRCLLGYLYALTTYAFMRFYLSRNKIVICDRYFYQFFFDLFGSWSEKIVKFFPKPDITFFLDGDLDIFYSRMNSSFDKSVSRNYYVDALAFYRKLSKNCGFVQVDASLSRSIINDTILAHLENHLKKRRKEGDYE